MSSLLWLQCAKIHLFLPHPHVRFGVMEMTAIDVGQGDSILLVTPEGRAM